MSSLNTNKCPAYSWDLKGTKGESTSQVFQRVRKWYRKDFGDAQIRQKIWRDKYNWRYSESREKTTVKADRHEHEIHLLDEMEIFFDALTKNTPPLRDDAVALTYFAQSTR